MPYDFDDTPDSGPPRVDTPTQHPSDLEVIVVLLDLAAIYLTPSPGTLFTFEELISKAHEIAGPECEIAPRDALIVLPFMKTIRKQGRRLYLS